MSTANTSVHIAIKVAIASRCQPVLEMLSPSRGSGSAVFCAVGPRRLALSCPSKLCLCTEVSGLLSQLEILRSVSSLGLGTQAPRTYGLLERAHRDHSSAGWVVFPSEPAVLPGITIDHCPRPRPPSGSQLAAYHQPSPDSVLCTPR